MIFYQHLVASTNVHGQRTLHFARSKDLSTVDESRQWNLVIAATEASLGHLLLYHVNKLMAFVGVRGGTRQSQIKNVAGWLRICSMRVIIGFLVVVVVGLSVVVTVLQDPWVAIPGEAFAWGTLISA